MPEVEVVQLEDKDRARFSLTSGMEVDLRTTSDRLFPFTLYQLTGTLSHCRAMLKKAKAMDFDLNQQGLRRDDQSILCKEEEGILMLWDWDFIPPN